MSNNEMTEKPVKDTAQSERQQQPVSDIDGWPTQATYCVKFTGYGAYVETRQEDVAYVRCIKGITIIWSPGGYVAAETNNINKVVRKLFYDRDKLEQIIDDAVSSKEAVALGAYTAMVEHGRMIISGLRHRSELGIELGASIGHFLLQCKRQAGDIWPLLDQVLAVSAQIDRQPFAECIDQINRTGVVRVVTHGVGYWTNGILEYHPRRSEAIVEQDQTAFRVCTSEDIHLGKLDERYILCESASLKAAASRNP